ncbi:hypothetical protein HanPI659440_Chr16g0622081 [Helianthus annuus]|nr:hypothetical protein HanPI659440_Chr16g0622081 [Helianthus annuus]
MISRHGSDSIKSESAPCTPLPTIALIECDWWLKKSCFDGISHDLKRVKWVVSCCWRYWDIGQVNHTPGFLSISCSMKCFREQSH